jgi:hypothetical protein
MTCNSMPLEKLHHDQLSDFCPCTQLLMICLPPSDTYPGNLQEWRQMCHSHSGNVILPTQVCPGCLFWIHFEGSFDSRQPVLGNSDNRKGGTPLAFREKEAKSCVIIRRLRLLPSDTRTTVCSSQSLCHLSGSSSGVSLSFPSHYKQVPSCILALPVSVLKDQTQSSCSCHCQGKQWFNNGACLPSLSRSFCFQAV